MSQKIIFNANQLYNNLLSLNLSSITGNIIFNLAGVSVTIKTTDTVGITLQSWLQQYLTDNNIYFSVLSNSQEFPDFFLDEENPLKNMLEVKAFNFNATPAFDMGNFDAYCSSVKSEPYRLDAYYLIFGYIMSDNGSIKIHKIWLKKIWEIAGSSARFPLKTQCKRGIIYNIRPNSNFKVDKPSPFNRKEDFLKAIYDTLKIYKGVDFANAWLKELMNNYQHHYGKALTI